MAAEANPAIADTANKFFNCMIFEQSIFELKCGWKGRRKKKANGMGNIGCDKNQKRKEERKDRKRVFNFCWKYFKSLMLKFWDLWKREAKEEENVAYLFKLPMLLSVLL